MDFDSLNKFVPYHLTGKEKSIRYVPYPNIVLAMPGRHANETTPLGGDFCVCVTDPVFKIAEHQFTHTDIFKVIEAKTVQPNPARFLMEDYLKIIKGADLKTPDFPRNWTVTLMGEYMKTMDDLTFLSAVQCLAVAEHRRYARYENKFGGRYLPFRFSAGIAEGLWSAADAAGMQKRGRPGVEILEKLHGTPKLTQDLMT